MKTQLITVNAIALIILLTGCGSDSNGDVSPAPSSTTSNTESGAGSDNIPAGVSGNGVGAMPNTNTLPTTGDTFNTPNTDEAPTLLEAEYPANPGELQRTWNAARVRLPNGLGNYTESNVAALQNGAIKAGESYPVIIYLHGCSGFWPGSDTRMNWFASQGFVSIAPNSFARSFYPESCSLSSREGWKYKPTVAMRQFDTANTLEQLRGFDWVDQNNIFIYGFSEGGVIAATFNSTDERHKVNARLIESWSCVSIPWEEYQGIQAPESEPVLSLFADQDPWLQGDGLIQSCGDFISQTNASQAVLFDYEPLRTLHPLFEQSEAQELILNFLLQKISPLPGQ